MKFNSIQSLLTNARETLERFPLAIFSAVIGSIAAIILTNYQNPTFFKSHWYLLNLSMVGFLGISLLLCVKVYIESHQLNQQKSFFLQGACVFLLVMYYFLLPKELKGFDVNRYSLVSADLHLLVAVAPFLFMANRINAFWQYNKALFIRIIISFIYSNTIFAGLAIAIGVTDYLFEVIKFKPEIYSHLWIAVVGIFNTWFFLGGVPKNMNHLEEDKTYPKGLRIFTQFILIPLVFLYLGILYLYMGKIILMWSLPKGYLSSFIIGAATLGILTLLLVHPLTEKEEYGWFKTYRRYFYLALFPLIILMAVAIGRRISDYGITEQRYFVLLFTAWLLIVAIRFTFKPNSNIRMIPITLFLLVALATWGPWSAMSVSKHSQIVRLKSLLTSNGLLEGKKLIKSTQKVENKIQQEISSITYYLEKNFGLQVLEKNFTAPAKGAWKDLGSNQFMTQFLGLEYIGPWRRYESGDGIYFSLYSPQNQMLAVKGYDYYAAFNLYDLQNRPKSAVDTIHLPEGEIEIWFDPNEGLSAGIKGHLVAVSKFSDSWFQAVREKNALSQYNQLKEPIIFKGENQYIRFQISIQSIAGIDRGKDKSPVINSISGNILFSVFKNANE